MIRTAALADHLDARVDAILAAWKAAVGRSGDVPDASQLSHAEFIDHIPEILEQIAERLRGEPAEVADNAHKHGRVRWRQGYDVAEMINELAHLRTTLIRATFAHTTEPGAGPETAQLAILAINSVLDEATAESVRQFQEEAWAETQGMLTEVRQRNEAVNAERSKLQTVLNNLPVGVWVVNADGLIAGVNREGERLQGSPASDAVNRVSIFHPADHYDLTGFDGRPLTADDLPGVKALRGEEVEPIGIRWRNGDRVRSISTTAAPLTNPDGSIAGAVIVGEDVTERERLKADLATSELRFRTIAEQSPMMIWRSDTSGRCDYFNQTWLDFRGRTMAMEAGRGWAEGVHPDDMERCLVSFLEAGARRAPFEITYRLLRRDGAYREILDRGAPSFDARGEFLGYLGSCMDITERVEYEKSLERQSEHKGRLMAALSHDARTPLNAVVLAAQLLQTQVLDESDPEVQESLRVIRDSVRNVLDLLSDLLDLSRIDAGATPPEVTRFPLISTLTECLSSIEPQARAKGLDVRFEPDGLTEVHLGTDRNKLKQILANLLSNALHYTDGGRIRLFGEVTPELIRISVEDTGVGIAPEDRGKIFDEFATLGTGRRMAGGGTGLGLAICRRLVNLLHGEILLDSAPGRGSTFTIALPASLVVPGDSTPAAPALPVSPATGSILIAEDHEPSRRALARVLQRIGYRVLEAGSGDEAVDLARAERPFIILMDVNMPGMDGIEATRILRADPTTRDLPIFALTGDVTVVNRMRIGEAGVDGYLEKPVSWDQIDRALARVSDRLPK